MGNTFTESARNPITHYCLSTPRRDWDGRGWKEERKGGAGRGAAAAGSAFLIWMLTQAPGMPRKGVGSHRAGWDPVGTRRCRESTHSGMGALGLLHTWMYLHR